jgi:cell wall-associated NlpC family hydrolase
MKAYSKAASPQPVVVAKPTTTTTQTPQEKACTWGKKIAKDNSWHYVKWSDNAKTHECPICKNHPKGKYHGWNCIGFAWACWKHGAGIKCKCNNHVIDNACAEKILKASDANALKIVKEKSGLKDVEVIRNNGDVIPQSKLKAGDICMNYKGKKYQHTFLYLGNGKMVDAQGSSGKISTNNQIKVRKAVNAKVAIRYTGK